MGSVNGRILKCDRCGKEIFLKATGEGETDGGFTRWNKFEEAPGWGYDSRVGIDLCPECRKELDLFCENFIQNKESNKELVLDIIDASEMRSEVIDDGNEEVVAIYLTISSEKLNEVAKKYGVFIWEALNK